MLYGWEKKSNSQLTVAATLLRGQDAGQAGRSSNGNRLGYLVRCYESSAVGRGEHVYLFRQNCVPKDIDRFQIV